MTDINSLMSLKRYRLAVGLTGKQNLFSYLQEAHLLIPEKHFSYGERTEKELQANGTIEQAGVAILTK